MVIQFFFILMNNAVFAQDIEIKDGVRIVHNKRIISDNISNIEIRFVQKIGDYDSKDDNYLFYQPRDMAVDSYGNIYILDGGNFRIQKFDAQGKFLRTIGGKGQGPAEFITPVSIEIDNDDNIHVLDVGQKRIEVIKPDGKELKRYPVPNRGTYWIRLTKNNEYVGGFRILNLRGASGLSMLADDIFFQPVLHIFDNRGSIKKEFVNRKSFNNTILRTTGNDLFFSVDTNNNIYVAFKHQNRIEKYSPDGKLLMKISREKNFSENDNVHYVNSKTNPRIVVINRFAAGIGIDNSGRISVLSFTRATTGSDFDYYRENNGESPPGMMELEIYDKDGLLKGSFQINLNVNSDLVRIHNDRLFIIDQFVGMAILEYKIIEK